MTWLVANVVGEPRSYDGSNLALYRDEALRRIAAHDAAPGAPPLFLMPSFSAPHRPLLAPRGKGARQSRARVRARLVRAVLEDKEARAVLGADARGAQDVRGDGGGRRRGDRRGGAFAQGQGVGSNVGSLLDHFG